MIYGYIRVSSDKQTSRYAQAMRGCFASALCGYIVCAFCAPIAIAHAGERTHDKTELSLLVGDVIYRAIGGSA